MSRSMLLKIFKWIVVTVTILTLLLVVAIAVLVWQRPWIPFLDDGPFKGLPVQSLPKTTPLQIFPVRDFVLEVYAPLSKEQAPIVLLRNHDKQVKWAVHAEGMENTQVSSLKFIDYRTIFGTTVRGTVQWTYGHEAMWWMIGRDGSLNEYWYSW